MCATSRNRGSVASKGLLHIASVELFLRLSFSAVSFPVRFSSLQSLPELPLLLQHLQLQSLDTITQSLLTLPNCSRAELFLCSQLTTPGSLLLRLSTVFVVIIIWAGQTTLLKLCAGFECFNATLLTLDLGVCAGKEKSYIWSDFIT